MGARPVIAPLRDSARGALRRRRLAQLLGIGAAIILAGLAIGGPGIEVSV